MSVESRQARTAVPVGRTAIVLAVATTLALAVLLAVFLPDRHAGSPARASGPGPSGFVGHSWTVVGVRDRSGTLVLPVDIRASISFSRHGRVFGDDTVNDDSGRFRRTSHGYVVSDVLSTAVGYGGSDPDRVRVIEGVDAVFLGSGRSSAEVSASLDGRTLTLRRGRHVLTLVERSAHVGR